MGFRPHERKTESGQAIIEYILILVVVVAILLGLMNQFHSGFQEYTEEYFGEYLACLIEVGELPALQVADGDPPVCEPPGFDPDLDGASGSGSGSGGGGGGGGQSNAGKNSGSDSANKNSAGSQDLKNRKGSGGGNGEGSTYGAGASSPSLMNQRNRQRTIAMESETDDEGTPGGTGLRKVRPSTQAGARGVDGKKIISTGQVISDEKTTKKETKVPMEKVKGENQKERKIAYEAAKPKPLAPDAENEKPFGIGSFFRYLLIAAIIIALVVLIGGQAAQISKSWEK